MESLAEGIAVDAHTISHALSELGHAQPSFQSHGPKSCLPPNPSPEVEFARARLMDASLKIFQLAAGPNQYLTHLSVKYECLACLRWLCHFRIPDLVPPTGAITYRLLSKRASVDQTELERVLRMMMADNVFRESADGQVAHSSISLLFTDPNFSAAVHLHSEIFLPAAMKYVDQCEKRPTGADTSQTAYNLALGTKLPFFEYMQTSPDKARAFELAMKSVAEEDGNNIRYLVSGFDWAKLDEAMIVDVGGSTGYSCIALASAFPKLRFIVQDLAVNASNAAKELAPLPRSVRLRISFQSHDFFLPQPAFGHEVYLLRMILHDWPVSERRRILANLVPALRDGSRIIIMDMIKPTPGSLTGYDESAIRARDLMMKQMFNSEEQSIEQWRSLIHKTDSRLKLTEVRYQPGSSMSILVVVFRDRPSEH
ncbi:S-adenosyl-L-methionine-dependent methyltransferase [Macrophomina phaseolina]|uniref:S-adenosyl-L-methionine-dependent methyltransferase n=1 Tax=Macrophomina phaseolina TaxID=35725 RepID=A0ABQ8GMA7_9PEZI|nr:S-adenosyl-L-methionine-dependent methyltransferase [Macrophomina phaseolina]